MGLLSWFRRPRGREYVIRADFESLPQDQWTDDEYDHWFANLPDDEAWGQWEAWSRQTIDPPRGIRGIRRSCLDMALQAAEETDGIAIAEAAERGITREDGGAVGAEFACLLRIPDTVVEELVLLPGTVAGDEHAIFDTSMAGVDAAVRGSLHSHPDEHPYPSDADFELFSKQGDVHLILCRPYGPDDWRAYDFAGRPIHLEVLE